MINKRDNIVYDSRDNFKYYILQSDGNDVRLEHTNSGVERTVDILSFIEYFVFSKSELRKQKIDKLNED